MSCYLKEIIDKIIEIDSMAFENKTKSEQMLLSKKQEYENLISSYRGEKLTDAKNKAQKIAEETNAFIMQNEKSQTEQVKNISASIDSRYSKSEKKLIQKIFNKLFVLEG